MSIRSLSDDDLPRRPLEELPPERGTLLELHSINAQYDGTLVEFRSLDKKSGRYFVQTFSDDEEDYDDEKIVAVVWRCNGAFEAILDEIEEGNVVASFEETKEWNAFRQKILHICRKTMESCTRKDGSIHDISNVIAMLRSIAMSSCYDHPEESWDMLVQCRCGFKVYVS